MLIKIKRGPIIFFLTVIAAVVIGMGAFVQSARFAKIIKSAVAKNTPREWGIQGDFSEFALQVFPLGIAIKNPKVVLEEGNIVNLPKGSEISAKRIELRVSFWKMLRGSVGIHEAAIIDGQVSLTIDPKTFQKKKTEESRFTLNWDELFQLKAESIIFQNTLVRLTWLSPQIKGEFTAKNLTLSQVSEGGQLGYSIELEVDNVRADFPQEWVIPNEIQKLSALGMVNSSGVNIRKVFLQAEGIQAQVEGDLKGDIFSQGKEPLLLDTSLKLSGDLFRIVRALHLESRLGGVSGEVDFQGSIAGNLRYFYPSLLAKGQLQGKGLRFQSWSADTLKTEGSWAKGAVDIQSAVLRSDVMERQAPKHLATGGEIRIGAFKLPVGERTQFSVPVLFENVHVQWLGAPAPREIFPLNFRFSGSSEVLVDTGVVNKRWSVQSKINFRIPNFQLDNQSLGRVKKLSRIVNVNNLQIVGDVFTDATGVSLQQVKLSLPNTQFLANGKIDFKTGYDLRVVGKTDLKDIETLAEVPIVGQGDLSATVKGPTSHVLIHFDTDLQKTEYLNLNLGSIKGRITYDDKDQFVAFDLVDVLQGRTRLKPAGRVHVGEKDQAALQFTFNNGTIEDLNQIFDRLSRDLWWFPRSVAGDASGTISVRGPLDINHLKVFGQLQGKIWDFYGEKFKDVTLNGGYDSGRYFVDTGRAYKNKALLDGRISFQDKASPSGTPKISWNFHSQDLHLRDLDWISRVDVPIRGDLNIASQGETLSGQIKSSSDLRLENFVVRGNKTPASEVLLETNQGFATLRGRGNGDQASLYVDYDFKKGARNQMLLTFKKFDFSPLLIILNPYLINDPSLIANLTGLLEMKFLTEGFEQGSGRLRVDEFILKKSESNFSLEKPASAIIEQGTFAFPDVVLVSSENRAVLQMQSHRGNISGRMTGPIDLRLFEFLTPVVEMSRGQLDLQWKLAGQLLDPKITGSMELQNGVVKVRDFEGQFTQIDGPMAIKDGVISLQQLTSSFAGGSVTTRGTIEVFTNKFPTLNLESRFSGNKVKIFPFEFAVIRGNLQVQGEQRPYRVAGDFFVDSAMIREKILNQQKGPQKKLLRFVPSNGASRDEDVPTFLLDIRARADQRVFVKNDLFDAELKGDVRILNTISAPRIMGESELLKGKLSFKGRDFDIKSAKIEFDNPNSIDPKFDLTSLTQVGDKKIQLFALGRPSNWRVEFSSDPPMPEQEIVSLLALGFTAEEMRRFNSEEQSVLQRGEAASLLLHATDFNRDVQERTGLEVNVEQSEDTLTGQSIARPQSDEAAAGTSPKIVVKKRLTKNVGVSVGSTVGAGNTSQQEFNAEINVTPNASVIGVWENFQGTDTQESQTSYGVDFKLQKRFK